MSVWPLASALQEKAPPTNDEIDSDLESIFNHFSTPFGGGGTEKTGEETEHEPII